MTALARNMMGASTSNPRSDWLRDARILDVASYVRTSIAGVPADDIMQVAVILVDAFDAKEPLTKDFVISKLMQEGRSKHRAQTIANALLK